MKPLQALLALFAFAFLPLHAAGLDDLTITTTDGEVTISDCNEAATGELVIPNTIEGNPVTSIGNNAFAYCRSLTSITIPDSVTSIGSRAFADCTNLTSITIPDSLTSIGFRALAYCTSLTSVTIPDGVTSIGNDAFRGCSSLTSITIPDSVTGIGEGAFQYCSSLTSITFQGVAPSVGASAFKNTPDGAVAYVTIENQASFGGFGQKWNRLTVSNSNDVIDLTWTTNNGEVTITDCDTAASGLLVIPATIGGKPVTSIGDSAFADCTSLTSITIGNGVTSIGDDAFLRCTSLTSITIPDSVTSIGENAFAYCTSLKNITIPNSVESIKSRAFVRCTSLTSITIPDSVTSIGFAAFYDCTSLTSITFLGTAPTTVGDQAFSGVPNGAKALVVASTSFGESGADWNGLTVERILTWTTTNGEVTITDCNEAAASELTIPATIGGKPVTSIGEYAFQGCTSLTNITIPDGVITIGSVAFVGCTSLTSITIPDDVTSIGNRAFYNCTSLTSITIPDSMTLIAGGTFEKCTSLTSITIHDQVTSISYDAFADCTSLTSITIPNSVTLIERYAFYSCGALSSITFMGAAPTVGSEAFTGMANGAVALVTIEDQTSFGDLGADWNGLTVSMSVSDMITALNAQNAAVATARTAGQGDVTTAPASYNLTTTESYNTVVAERDAAIAERDARFTEDQIRTMSVDHTVGQNEAGNMQVEIAFIQSADLNNYIPFTVPPDSLSVVDGKICMEFPPSDAENFFFRFRIE